MCTLCRFFKNIGRFKGGATLRACWWHPKTRTQKNKKKKKIRCLLDVAQKLSMPTLITNMLYDRKNVYIVLAFRNKYVI